MKIMITGATGLLGRAINKELKKTYKNILALGFKREHPEIIKLDLTDSDLVKTLILTEKPDVIIHAAAERRPDITSQYPAAAQQLNVAATENLAKLAKQYGIFIVYISTDYVFDGTAAPYFPENKPNPINLYGKTKFLGEQALEKYAENYAILRVPILYGDQESLAESAVSAIMEQIQTNPNMSVDNWAIRYPTYVGDVAVTLKQLLEKIDITNCREIFHWSGNEQFTKYEMAKIMGHILNINVEKIKHNNLPSTGAPRPKNCKLNCSKIEDMKIGKRTPFSDVIKNHLMI